MNWLEKLEFEGQHEGRYFDLKDIKKLIQAVRVSISIMKLTMNHTSSQFTKNALEAAIKDIENGDIKC